MTEIEKLRKENKELKKIIHETTKMMNEQQKELVLLKKTLSKLVDALPDTDLIR